MDARRDGEGGWEGREVGRGEGGGALPALSGRSSVAGTMAAAKKKTKVQASDVAVGNRTLDGVLIDLAEQIKANDARYAERDARYAERVARTEELVTIALQTVAAVSQDLRALSQDVRALTQDVRALAVRTDDRLGALEKTIAAE